MLRESGGLASTAVRSTSDSGTTKRHRLEENIGAVDVELSGQDLNEIDSAFSHIDVMGARLPEQVLAMSNR